MSLQERLDTIRTTSRTRLPGATLAVMDRAVEAVRASGLVARAVKVGDRMPRFALTDTRGTVVSSDALLDRGPLVVSFYRGRW